VTAPHFAQDVIEGEFRVVASRPLPRPFRLSPNRQRAAARILIWNLWAGAAAFALPYVLR